MGRGKAWDGDENALLARAWIAASEDPTIGASKQFYETMQRRFVENSQAIAAGMEGNYAQRHISSIRNHFAHLSTDAPKFFVALRTVRALFPTGVTKDKIISMAVAVHVGKTARMDYQYKFFDVFNLLTYKAWLVFRNHSKWTVVEEGNVTGSQHQGSSSTQSYDIAVPNPSSFLHSSEVGDAIYEETTTAINAGMERYRTGIKKAKAFRQEEMRTEAVRSMAESAKRKSDALEEQNEILVFSQTEAENHPDTKAFFAAIRQTYLARALKKARIAEDDNAASSSSSLAVTPNIPPSDSNHPAAERVSPTPASNTPQAPVCRSEDAPRYGKAFLTETSLRLVRHHSGAQPRTPLFCGASRRYILMYSV